MLVEKVGHGGRRGLAEKRRGYLRIPHLRSVMSFLWIYPRRLSVGLGKAAILEGELQVFQCVAIQKGLQSLPTKLF